MTLSLEQVGFSYAGGGFTLSIEELRVTPGECVALVGPSGSGKTTLLNLVAGIATAQRGNILLGDIRISALGARARRRLRLRRMGLIFQSFELLDYLDVRDNILLQARLAPGVAVDGELEARALAVADSVGLADKWRQPVTALSQGERQRVAAGRALLLQPDLVLADEPTGNLDPDNKRAVLEQLLDQCRRRGHMLLTVTHDHSLLPAFDRVVDMASLLRPEAAQA